MAELLRVLLVEDVADDAELVLLELRRGGYEPVYQRVDTAEAMRRALGEQDWQVVISDYCMPYFDAPGALRVLQAHGPDVPFIIVSGTIGEDTAVAAMKAGANDYLIKGQLKRLVPTIEREMREREVRVERRRAEQALRHSEARFRALIERLPDFVVVHRDGRVIYANPAATEGLGGGAESLVGMAFADLVHPDDRGAALRPAKSPELRWLRRDGALCTVQVSEQSLVFDGEPAIVTVARDISEHKKIQAQLLVSDRMASVGTLAAGVAHEINNPLSAVLANLDHITAQLASAETGAKDVLSLIGELEAPARDAREAAHQVRQIVRDLKIFSRVGDDRRDPVDVHRVLESTIRMAWNEIRHRARLVRDYGEVPAALADEARLGQVFLNLIVNAAQAMPDGQAERHEIRVVTRVGEGDRVIVAFHDDGGGIPEDILDKIFTPFFTTKPIGVGTGLGLSICYRIISSLGGAITVDSKVGKGTVFRVALPAAHARAVTLIEPAIAPPREDPRGRILVVDDEPLIGNAVQRILGKQHDVTAVSSVSEALGLIDADQRFDLILCDLMMPQMTGMDFYEALGRTAPAYVERMIFITGGAFTQRARDFLDRMPNLHIEKPFDTQKLRDLVGDRLRSLASA